MSEFIAIIAFNEAESFKPASAFITSNELEENEITKHAILHRRDCLHTKTMTIVRLTNLFS